MRNIKNLTLSSELSWLVHWTLCVSGILDTIYLNFEVWKLNSKFEVNNSLVRFQ